MCCNKVSYIQKKDMGCFSRIRKEEITASNVEKKKERQKTNTTPSKLRIQYVRTNEKEGEKQKQCMTYTK
jgi:hypothetical protein